MTEVALSGAQIESQLFDLVFTENEPVEFEITGKKYVHAILLLSGANVADVTRRS